MESAVIQTGDGGQAGHYGLDPGVGCSALVSIFPHHKSWPDQGASHGGGGQRCVPFTLTRNSQDISEVSERWLEQA